MHPPLPRKDVPEGWRPRFAALRHVPPLLRLVWETSPPLALTSVVLRLAAAALPPAMLYVAKLIVDAVVAATRDGGVVPERLWWLLGAEFGLAVLGDALGRGVALCESLLGDKFTNHLSLRLMEHAGRLDLVTLEDPKFHDTLERARRQTTARLGMLSALSALAQQAVTLAALSVGLVAVSPWLLLLLVVAVVPAFLGEAKFSQLAYSLLFRQTPERRELDYLRLLGASQTSAKEVRIYGLNLYLTTRSKRLFDTFFVQNRSLSIRRATTGLFLNLLPTSGYYAAYTYMVAQTLAGAVTLGDLTFLVGAFSRSRNLIESLFSGMAGVSEQALFLEDLFGFFATVPVIAAKPGALPAPRPIRKGFEFRNVSFAYPGSTKPAVEGLSFTLGSGERIALLGENGAGKTTLVKLLARLYDPTEGQILLDGVDLREYDPEDLRREIGVVFQDYLRYDMRVRENVGFGELAELENDAALQSAIGKAHAATLVETLPNGLDQMLGRRFDGGADLSTGQWQRIALARAYLRDAQVLILDEPTASLDARAEYEVFQRLAELARGRMAVLISHRFSTVRMADRILVLEHGGLVEQGSHEELVRQGGRYAELFELQAAGYR